MKKKNLNSIKKKVKFVPSVQISCKILLTIIFIVISLRTLNDVNAAQIDFNRITTSPLKVQIFFLILG